MIDLIVYTALFGDYDRLPPVKPSTVPHVCFADMDITANGWEMVRVDREGDARRANRRIKITPPETITSMKWSLYIDASIEIQIPTEEFVDRVLQLDGGASDLYQFQHNERDCIYQEAAICVTMGLDDKKKIKKQIKRYREKGYPRNNGLYSNGIILRRHSNQVAQFNARWWREVEAYSVRD